MGRVWGNGGGGALSPGSLSRPKLTCSNPILYARIDSPSSSAWQPPGSAASAARARSSALIARNFVAIASTSSLRRRARVPVTVAPMRAMDWRGEWGGRRIRTRRARRRRSARARRVRIRQSNPSPSLSLPLSLTWATTRISVWLGVSASGDDSGGGDGGGTARPNRSPAAGGAGAARRGRDAGASVA